MVVEAVEAISHCRVKRGEVRWKVSGPPSGLRWGGPPLPPPRVITQVARDPTILFTVFVYFENQQYRERV